MEPETPHSPDFQEELLLLVQGPHTEHLCPRVGGGTRPAQCEAGADASTHRTKPNQTLRQQQCGSQRCEAVLAPRLLWGSRPFPQEESRLGVHPWPAVELGLGPRVPDAALGRG